MLTLGMAQLKLDQDPAGEGGKDAEHGIEKQAELERLVFAMAKPAWNRNKIEVSLAGAPDDCAGCVWSGGHCKGRGCG